MTHSTYSADDLKAAGISAGLIRLSWALKMPRISSPILSRPSVRSEYPAFSAGGQPSPGFSCPFLTETPGGLIIWLYKHFGSIGGWRMSEQNRTAVFVHGFLVGVSATACMPRCPTGAMANVRQISNKQLTEVLAEFEQEAEQFAALNINANDYLRSVLVKALGEERASSLLEDILETRDTASGIETLNFMEPQRPPTLSATSTRRLSPPSLSTSSVARRRIFWHCSKSACVTM